MPNAGIEKFSNPYKGKLCLKKLQEYESLALDIRSALNSMDGILPDITEKFNRTPIDKTSNVSDNIKIDTRPSSSLSNPSGSAKEIEVANCLKGDNSFSSIITELNFDIDLSDAFGFLDGFVHLLADSFDVELFTALDGFRNFIDRTRIGHKYNDFKEIDNCLRNNCPELYRDINKVIDTGFMYNSNGNFRAPVNKENINFNQVGGFRGGIENIGIRYKSYTARKKNVAEQASSLAPKGNIFEEAAKNIDVFI